ncbi:hypothetical protein BCR44DRAFT_23411 [Catenaria anguillulae PL171]|uniref:Uncharacterized protein n=1 Tax=Catenaria anguillulae PL171 TaxID=765915 RepID=A0A1Y2H600_9FUNG|nr:hypothetical protein BCR44DRAFT_23411 [Catenaria anguillulae PL171]
MNRQAVLSRAQRVKVVDELGKPVAKYISLADLSRAVDIVKDIKAYLVLHNNKIDKWTVERISPDDYDKLEISSTTQYQFEMDAAKLPSLKRNKIQTGPRSRKCPVAVKQDGKWIEFDTAKDAAEHLGVSKVAVHNALKGSGICKGCQIRKVE